MADAAIVSYDGKKLIPAPLVNITKEYQKTGDGENVGSIFRISLAGNLVSFRGSPASSGAGGASWNGQFWIDSNQPPDENLANINQFKSIIRKQEAIRELFSIEGKSLEIQPCDGSAPIKCNPRITDVNFPEGQWVERVPYTVSCEADVVLGQIITSSEDGFSEYISSANESWSIESNEKPESVENPHSFALSHTVSAEGKRFYDSTGALEKPAWQQARDWVLPRLGLDLDVVASSGAWNLPSYFQGFNHVRVEEKDEAGGSYSITETWILSSGSALEDFEVSINTSDETDITSVSIQGSIEGLETKTFGNAPGEFVVTTPKYIGASGLFVTVQSQLLNRAQAYSNITLNTTPKTTTIGRNPVAGTINYTYEYDNRPSNCINNALSESFTIIDTNASDVFASIPVLGRSAGPVLQDIGTTTATTREVNVEVVMPTVDTCPTNDTNVELLMAASPKTDVAVVTNAFKTQLEGSYNQVFTETDVENWSPKTGRYTRNIRWTYQ